MSEQTATSIAERIREDLIDNWLRLPSATVRGFRTGGSGAILTIGWEDGETAATLAGGLCLKIGYDPEAGTAASPNTSTVQNAKLVQEMAFQLQCGASGRVLPIHTRSGSVVDNDTAIRAADAAFRLADTLRAQPEPSLNREKVPEPLRDILYVNGAWLGYLTPTGVPLEDLLKVYCEVLGGVNPEQVRRPLPDWIGDYLSEGELTVEEYRKRFPSSLILDPMIEDLLVAVDGLHSQGIAHLDVKEANVMVLPHTGERKIKFVLFDFGSARRFATPDWAEVTADSEKFESTYDYLPLDLQRKRPAAEVTIPKKVSFAWSDVKTAGLSPFMLDVHAISQVVRNFLSDLRFKRLSASLSDAQFETAFSFSELLSADHRDTDGASAHRAEEPAKRALGLFHRGIKLQADSNQACPQWLSGCGDTTPIALGAFGVASSDNTDDYANYTHPATGLFRCRQGVFSKDKRVGSLLAEWEATFTRSADAAASALCRSPGDKSACRDVAACAPRTVAADKLRAALAEHTRPVLEAQLRFEVPLVGEVNLTPLLGVHLVKRMSAIRQLAWVHMSSAQWIAQHDRLEHSVGSARLAWLYLIALLLNSGWLRYRYSGDDGVFLLVSAFLHDIGHYPFAHYVEDTGVFPRHETVTRALLVGSLRDLKLVTKQDHELLIEGGWHELHPEDSGLLEEEVTPTYREHGITTQRRPCPLRRCDAAELCELHRVLAQVLDRAGLTTDDLGKSPLQRFREWYGRISALMTDTGQPLPGFYGDVDAQPHLRTLAGVLSGPIDADKVHYLASDSANCLLSVGALLEGSALPQFLASLRVPIRHREQSTSQRFCLGVKDGMGHLPELLMLLRGVMYAQVYWSERSRLGTTLLRHVVLESIRSIVKYGGSEAPELPDLVGSWIRAASDQDAVKCLCNLARHARAGEPGGPAPGRGVDLPGLCDRLVGAGPEGSYEEVCQILPRDGVAFANLQRLLGEFEDPNKREHKIAIGGVALKGPSQELIELVRQIVLDVLRLDKELLGPGDILVDVPAQVTSKAGEFPRFAMVDSQGFSVPAGGVWNATERYFESNIRRVRVYILRGRIALDRDAKLAVRSRIIERLS